MCTSILVTGMPGVGKTTAIKKIYEELRKHSINVAGFYTEEVRDQTRNRIGFDLVDLEGKRDILARVSEHETSSVRRPKVGKYSVYVDKISAFIHPIFLATPDVFIIDEIGKMELLCSDFEKGINSVVDKLDKGQTKIIVTVPKVASIRLVENLKTRKDAKLFNLTKTNRDKCYQEILDAAKKMLSIEK